MERLGWERRQRTEQPLSVEVYTMRTLVHSQTRMCEVRWWHYFLRLNLMMLSQKFNHLGCNYIKLNWYQGLIGLKLKIRKATYGVTDYEKPDICFLYICDVWCSQHLCQASNLCLWESLNHYPKSKHRLPWGWGGNLGLHGWFLQERSVWRGGGYQSNWLILYSLLGLSTSYFGSLLLNS